MNRRKFLTGSGIGLVAGGGYFGWKWYQSPSVPKNISVKTLYSERDILTQQSTRESESLAAREEFHTLIETQDVASREFISTNSVADFITATDFSESYLVLIQNGMQSQPDLVLDSIRRLEDGLQFDVTIDAPIFGVDDDLITHSLLVRITDRQENIPEVIEVDINGYV
ncbi:hypothetical protein NP511_22425 (plasmid) [Natrinema thermotolerans]|uniref:Uncharacterized protein n=1 Tax=Natrinema thermotolerans TaxID=121872 RepID=A0AAF0T125_9EURY|nr:hypothetical protein [Natrinema thermotolerans]WMT10261.1 hypothetical protein NP511_22425 [Natrinema thermotolerans]